jgi:hypothetical protein
VAEPLPVAPRAVVLVEGRSDHAALATLAARRGRDLHAERVAIVAMGGATNVSRFLRRYTSGDDEIALAGLCDEAEEGAFRRGLERAGFGTRLDRDAMERLGFFVCVADLEDELIRRLGADAVLQIVEREGELGSLRTFQKQPAQRDRPVEAQLRRFLGTRQGRKIRYAPLLVGALDPWDVPRPLDRVLAQV